MKFNKEYDEVVDEVQEEIYSKAEEVGIPFQLLNADAIVEYAQNLAVDYLVDQAARHREDSRYAAVRWG